MTLPKLDSPIVLVHGLFGFDRLQLGGMTITSYFPGILQQLAEAGNRVFVPALSPTGGVAHRALQLKNFINQHSPHEPVHMIAHSMGGLDARYMISRLKMGERVLSLTTLGTPHRGTSFADWSILRLERLVKPVMSFLSVPTQAFYDLTTAGCRSFNELVRDVPGVRYFSVAGRHDGSVLNPEWLLPYHIVLRAEGPNDGVVSINSAHWGEHLDTWDGDHFSLVNWFNLLGKNRGIHRDPTPRYQRILSLLADSGF